MKRLLVIGSTGLVGSKVAEKAGAYGYEAYGTQNARKSSYPRSRNLDITDLSAVMSLVHEIKPVAIVNTAALHNVDYCENHKDEAERVNVKGVKNLAEAASRHEARLIHLSTDYVFDGRTGQYHEFDKPNPLSYYALTKLEAEQAASKTASFAVARPSVIFGWNKLEAKGTPSSSGKTINFAMYLLDKLAKREAIRAVTDQFSSPTFADNLADAILKLVEYQKNGIFHTAGRSCISRYDFALKIAATFGYPENLVQPITSTDFQQLAPRPRNSCLNVDMTEKALGMRFLTVDEAIRLMRSQAISADALA
jgi:dTDP-4-dehydrorhamnose reductase